MQKFFNKILFGGGVLFDLCKWIILAAVVLILVNKFLFTVFIVDGLSMDPTLRDKEFVGLQKNSYSSKPPNRGDIVVAHYPGDPKKIYVKRIIGLPGEDLEIKDGKVYLDGIFYRENYLSVEVTTYAEGRWKLKEEEYFLMGDNRPNSNDSRQFGPVEKRFIIGRASLVFFPRLKNVN